MYPTDLNDREWEVIRSFFEKSDPRGTPAKYSRRLIVDAILYVIKTGCCWRYLPKDYPHWKTVYRHFQIWNERGVWEEALYRCYDAEDAKRIAIWGALSLYLDFINLLLQILKLLGKRK